MAIKNFIPEIWSRKILTRLRKRLVAGALVNTDYEGEIKEAGDSVRINEIGPITVNSHTRDAAITYQTLSDASKFLKIDQEKYFAVRLDDADRVQANVTLMNEATSEAGYAVGDTIDQFLLGLSGEAGATSGLGTPGTPITVTAGNIVEYTSLVFQMLSDNNAPQEGRWGVVPPWYTAILAQQGIEKETPNTEVWRNGFYARFLGFDMYESNNITKTNPTTACRMMFGTRQAISYAGQLAETEAKRLETYFADSIRGLYLYGGKVVRPNCLARLIGTKG